MTTAPSQQPSHVPLPRLSDEAAAEIYLFVEHVFLLAVQILDGEAVKLERFVRVLAAYQIHHQADLLGRHGEKTEMCLNISHCFLLST